MRFRGALFLAVILASTSLPTPARGQKVIDLTVDMLDRWFTAHDKEKSELKNVEPQVADLDGKINKFEQCKRDFEAAGAASGSRMGGLAARIAIKAKCGSSDSDGFRKDRTIRTWLLSRSARRDLPSGCQTPLPQPRNPSCTARTC